MEEFQQKCIEICSQYRILFQKEKNCKNLGQVLWKMSKEDASIAFSLLYEVLTEYSCNTNVDELLDQIRSKKLQWLHPSFDLYRECEIEADNFLIHPPEVEEGVIECRRCHSKKTFSFSKQTRRADESATVFVRCSQCYHTFKF